MNDRAAALGFEPRHHLPGRAHRRHHVHGQTRRPAFLGVHHTETRGVVDQHIDTPEHGMGVVEETGQRCGIANIAARGEHLDAERGEFGAGRFEGFGAARADRHIGAFAREFQRDRAADTFAGTRHDDALAFESKIHEFPLRAIN